MAFGNNGGGQKKDNDFIGARGTHVGQTKSGKDMVTLFLGKNDLEKLIEKIQENASDEGLKVSVIMGEYKGKPSASLVIGKNEPRKQGEGGGFGGGQKKSFGFKAKTLA